MFITRVGAAEKGEVVRFMDECALVRDFFGAIAGIVNMSVILCVCFQTVSRVGLLPLRRRSL
jgi:hypothetical protein